MNVYMYIIYLGVNEDIRILIRMRCVSLIYIAFCGRLCLTRKSIVLRSINKTTPPRWHLQHFLLLCTHTQENKFSNKCQFVSICEKNIVLFLHEPCNMTMSRISIHNNLTPPASPHSPWKRKHDRNENPLCKYMEQRNIQFEEVVKSQNL